MAAKDSEGFRFVMRLLAWGGAFQGKALVDEGDSIALTGAVCGQLCLHQESQRAECAGLSRES